MEVSRKHVKVLVLIRTLRISHHARSHKHEMARTVNMVSGGSDGLSLSEYP